MTSTLSTLRELRLLLVGLLTVFGLYVVGAYSVAAGGTALVAGAGLIAIGVVAEVDDLPVVRTCTLLMGSGLALVGVLQLLA